MSISCVCVRLDYSLIPYNAIHSNVSGALILDVGDSYFMLLLLLLSGFSHV